MKQNPVKVGVRATAISLFLALNGAQKYPDLGTQGLFAHLGAAANVCPEELLTLLSNVLEGTDGALIYTNPAQNAEYEITATGVGTSIKLVARAVSPAILSLGDVFDASVITGWANQLSAALKASAGPAPVVAAAPAPAPAPAPQPAPVADVNDEGLLDIEIEGEDFGPVPTDIRDQPGYTPDFTETPDDIMDATIRAEALLETELNAALDLSVDDVVSTPGVMVSADGTPEAFPASLTDSSADAAASEPTYDFEFRTFDTKELLGGVNLVTKVRNDTKEEYTALSVTFLPDGQIKENFMMVEGKTGKKISDIPGNAFYAHLGKGEDITKYAFDAEISVSGKIFVCRLKAGFPKKADGRAFLTAYAYNKAPRPARAQGNKAAAPQPA